MGTSWRKTLGPRNGFEPEDTHFALLLIMFPTSSVHLILHKPKQGMCDLGFEPTSGHIVLQKRTSPVVQAILREQGVVEMLAKSVHELRRDDAEVMTDEFVQLGQ